MQTDLSSFLQLLLPMSTAQAPLFLVSLVALVVIAARWRHAPAACLWALAGFGLRLILCAAIPVVQAAVHYSRIQGQQSARDFGVLLSGLSLLWSVLAAASYALILVAIFVGRTKSEA